MKRFNYRKLTIWPLVSVLIALMIVSIMPASGLAMEEDPNIENVDQEPPSFSSPAQVERAKNLSAQSISDPDPETVAALEALEDAEKALQEAIASDDKAAIDAAQAEFEKAKALADASIAEAGGVTVDDIAGMRKAGMGWGQIAHELGIHPGALGLGHNKAKTTKGWASTSIREATTRDAKTGKAKGHGVDMGNRSGSKGVGLSRASVNKSAKAASGSKGLGHSGKDKSGGKGGGKGGSNGGGKGGGKGGGNGGGKGGGKK